MSVALGLRREALQADCARCAGLCCVAPAFAASADFALDKPAGSPCPHLDGDFRCGIHDSLRDRGFPGCTVFDCFGAGQQVVQGTFGGQDWRVAPEAAEAMFDAFGVMRQLHEVLWHLEEARVRVAGCALERDVVAALARIRRMTGRPADELAVLEVAATRRGVGVLLERVAGVVRDELGLSAAADHRGADLIGAELRGWDLRGVSLRGCYLIGADLRGADLDAADLLGADLRGADVRGADLGGSLFLTQPQLDAARGDAGTVIPGWAVQPAHWAATAIPAAAAPPRRR